MSADRFARDGVGVLRAVDSRGTAVTFEAEWNAVLERGDVGAAGLRTVSKGSSRGDGPKVKQGRVRRRGGPADDVKLCRHGQRSVRCACGWHCECPGSLVHVCLEAA